MAVDGLGRRSPVPASVEVRVDDDDLTFEMPQYEFTVREDVSPYSDVGVVHTAGGGAGAGGRGRQKRLDIFDSNADGFLSVDPATGVLRTEARLDHETRPVILLNLMMDDRDTGKESYCQVGLGYFCIV